MKIYFSKKEDGFWYCNAILRLSGRISKIMKTSVAAGRVEEYLRDKFENVKIYNDRVDRNDTIEYICFEFMEKEDELFFMVLSSEGIEI